MQYYDIFVRNAFANFRDVLREVSYSPMMANYLTFLDNKAISYDRSYPDENFAREIMQVIRAAAEAALSPPTNPPSPPIMCAAVYHRFVVP